jgi:fumarylacetoacetate (FAA) hydrolase
MKFCSFRYQGKESWGLLAQNQKIADLSSMAPSLGEYLKSPWWENNTKLKTLASTGSIALDAVEFLACVPKPTSMRDGYAFRQHVEAARKNRGAPMIPEFDLFPIFYYTNHQAVIGPGPCRVRSAHLEKLDFELEAAIVIGKEGIDISAEKADEYIFGYTIMNDFSARHLQMEEMKMSLGPAKGKDFATALGPWLVTTDELKDKAIPSPKGMRYDLEMTATVNGKQVSLGNTKDMTWTFAQILERISYGTKIYPGDVIGSGTVGTGCFMELNGSGITNQWLKNGDEINLDIERLGQLKNTIKHYEP